MAFIEMHDIVKVYPNGVVANNGVNFSLERGEIHALVGENGAGKSTLMKILYGMEPPTSGEILMDGRPLRFHRGNGLDQCRAANVCLVHTVYYINSPAHTRSRANRRAVSLLSDETKKTHPPGVQDVRRQDGVRL